MSTATLPEKRSAEDSYPIDSAGQGKVIREVRFLSTLEDLDSDDDMNFDPPGSIEVTTDRDVRERPKLNTCEDNPDYDTMGQQETKGYPANWVAYCGVCGEMTDHYSRVCPYRCAAVYEDHDRCFKKLHGGDNHLFRTLVEPSFDIKEWTGCD